MTLKNLLITTEKTIQISNFRIVSRLRCVICILISFICILSVQNNCFAQEPLELKLIAGIYQNTDYITNLKPNQALMLISAQPAGPIGDIQIFTYTDIIKNNYDFTQYSNPSTLGRFYNESNTGVRRYLSLIDDKYFYAGSFPGNNFVTNLLPQINQKLLDNNLGTILARQNYISFLNNHSLDVTPVNFASFLSRWILFGILIAIAIPPLWWIVRRFLR